MTTPSISYFLSRVDDALDDFPLDEARRRIHAVVVELWELQRDAELRLGQATARLSTDEELAERYRILDERTRELEQHHAVFGPPPGGYGHG
jgi:DNA-directed RNA polymerase sigma subunit (sigma70/sigma32)